MSHSADTIIVAEAPLNRNNVLRAQLSTHKGHRVGDIRKWYRDESGELKPGKGGLCLAVDRWEDVLSLTKDLISRIKSESSGGSR